MLQIGACCHSAMLHAGHAASPAARASLPGTEPCNACFSLLPQVLGFSYNLMEDQLAYLLSEAQVGTASNPFLSQQHAASKYAHCCLTCAPNLQPATSQAPAASLAQVEGLSLEAVPADEVQQVLEDEVCQSRVVAGSNRNAQLLLLLQLLLPPPPLMPPMPRCFLPSDAALTPPHCLGCAALLCPAGLQAPQRAQPALAARPGAGLPGPAGQCLCLVMNSYD